MTKIEIHETSEERCGFGGESTLRSSVHVKKNAVLFIIDALRLDFLLDKGNFPTLHGFIESKPAHTAVFQLFADPPTVTAQRLKGITAGGLPTFIDMNSNFNSAVLQEDNIIDQLKKFNRRLQFLGDDTWKALFPTQFDVIHPFDSFNTKVSAC